MGLNIKHYDEKCSIAARFSIYISVLSLACLLSIYISSFVVDSQFRNKTFKVEKQSVDFLMKDGTKLEGAITKPIDAKRKFPLLLCINYDIYDLQGETSLQKTATHFASHGISFVQLSPRGQGNNTRIPALTPFDSQNIDDGMQVLEQINERYSTDGNIGLFGHGISGGFAVKLLSEAKHKYVNVMVLVNPSFDPCRIEDYTVTATRNMLNKTALMMSAALIKASLSQLKEINATLHKADEDQRIVTPFQYCVSNLFLQHNEYKSLNILKDLNYSNILVPIYIIQGMSDASSSVTDTLQFYESIKGHYSDIKALQKEDPQNEAIPPNLPIDSLEVKLVIGPSGSLWIDDYKTLNARFDSRLEAVNFVKFNIAHMPVYTLEPDLTVFIRDNQNNTMQGYWQYEAWPIPHVKMVQYCMSDQMDAGILSEYPSCPFSQPIEKPISNFGNNPVLRKYWDIDSTALYAQYESNVYNFTMKFNEKTEVVGEVLLGLSISFPKAKAVTLKTITAILEYVPADIDSKINGANLVTSKTFNLIPMNNEFKTVDSQCNLHLHGKFEFTTWTFYPGDTMRLSFLSVPNSNITVHLNNRDSFITIPRRAYYGTSPRSTVSTQVKPSTDLDNSIPPPPFKVVLSDSISNSNRTVDTRYFITDQTGSDALPIYGQRVIMDYLDGNITTMGISMNIIPGPPIATLMTTITSSLKFSTSGMITYTTEISGSNAISHSPNQSITIYSVSKDITISSPSA